MTKNVCILYINIISILINGIIVLYINIYLSPIFCNLHYVFALFYARYCIPLYLYNTYICICVCMCIRHKEFDTAEVT